MRAARILHWIRTEAVRDAAYLASLNQRLSHAVQGALKHGPRTADIEANEARAAGPVHTSAVQVDLRFAQEKFLHVSKPVVDWPSIDPDQKRGVRPHWPHAR